MNRPERRRGTLVVSRAEQAALARRRRTILYGSLGLLAIVAIVAVALASRVPPTASNAPILAQLSVGQAAPDFKVSTTGGEFVLAQSSGQPVLLEVFATWCPHCQREVTAMNKLHEDFNGRAHVVGVSGSPYAMDTTSAETQADVVNFMEKFGAHYPLAFDPELDVAKKYLQGGYPTIVLIGRDGRILAIGSGEVPLAGLHKALANALAGAPVDPAFGLKKS